jgi:hypothetical protein
VSSVTALVVREMGAAVRSSGGITSPYFAHGRLHRELDRLRDRLAQVAGQRPDLLAVLAADLGVPATYELIVAEVEDRARNLLDRRLERALPPRDRPTPRRVTRPVTSAEGGRDV